MGRVVALLKGVNVGGHNKAPSAELKRVAGELGLGDPATLLNSGNLLFEAGGKRPAALETLLEKALKAKMGLSCDVHVRTHADLRKIAQANPFAAAARDEPNRLMVLFMRAPPEDAAKVEASADGLPEKVKVAGREVFVHYPDGAGVSKLRLPADGTMRNWNTVQKLLALTGG